MTPTEMHIDALMEKIERLEAENARYRKALEDIKTNIPWALIEHIKKLSEEALKGGE